MTLTTALHAGSSSRPVLADAADPFVLGGRRLRLGWALENTARFSDDVWNLAPAMLKQHERRFILDFTRIPARYRQVAKELCFAMLSGPLPPGEDRPAVGTVRTVFTEYVRFLCWVDGRARRLDALTGADLEDFQRFLIASLPAAGARQTVRAGARRFWLWRKALPSDALRFDPSHLDGWGEPTAQRGRENATARIPEDVLGPLFAWAMRFIDEFATDILAADRAWRTNQPPSGEKHAYGQLPVLLKALLDEHIAHRRPLPGWRGKPSTTEIAKALGRNRVSLGRYHQLIDQAADIVGVAPAAVSNQPVVGRLDDRPWIEAILADHTRRDSLAALARHLQTACYLVLAFLSGARDSEIKHLRRGGLAIERDADGGALSLEDAQPGIQGRGRPRRDSRRLEHRRTRRSSHRRPGEAAAAGHRAPLRPPPAQPRQQARRSQPSTDQRRHQRAAQQLPRLDQRLLWPARPARRHPLGRRADLASEEQPIQKDVGLVHRPPSRRRHRWRPGLSAPLHPGLRGLRGDERVGLPRRG